MDRFEFFSKLPRAEPGGASYTSAYLTHVQIKASDVVLELGCEGGDLATWVSRSRGCRVVAVEQERRYLPIVQRRAEEGGAAELVVPMIARYNSLPFADNAFRLVVAEGAALTLGLKQALTLWRRLVMPQGHIALTYPGVVKKDSPSEVREPLERRMIEPLGTLADYHATIRAAGYEVVHQVPLQPDLWEGYYAETVRHAWALVSSGEVAEEEPAVHEVLEEARWYRQAGRGRVFLQAMVLRRVR